MSLISDQELLARLRRSLANSQRCCDETWKLISETHRVMRRITVIGSPAISSPADSPGLVRAVDIQGNA
jgi:hypothetical protein